MKKLALQAFSLALTLIAMASGPNKSGAGQAGSAYDFTFGSIDGATLPLAGFKGKVLLVVNTASFCGFTQQYKGLQALYAKYEPRGLVIIGVPSNDFGAQEPKAEGEIKQFCEGAFGVTFPLASKTVVKGDGAHPFYAWARETLGERNIPRWNFHKYLVGRDGGLITAFGTGVEPDDKLLIAAVETALAKEPAAASQ